MICSKLRIERFMVLPCWSVRQYLKLQNGKDMCRSYDFTETYVFVKQWPRPGHCDLLKRHPFPRSYGLFCQDNGLCRQECNIHDQGCRQDFVSLGGYGFG
ncbi:hypothetical protein QL285_036858 [Trifolium repens]|nr:hypothetical protein QL285_036858 [Trifolium repens]